MKNKFNLRVIIATLSISLVYLNNLFGQQHEEANEKYTPYELLSSYYDDTFKPFSKKNSYVGLSFSLADTKLTNTDYLVQQVLDGNRNDFNILLKGGYYTGDYGMVGFNFNYYQNKFIGDVYREPDTIQSNSITRGFAFTPNIRSSFPLTKNERLSMFTEFGLTFGISNSLNRSTKNVDVVDKTYGTDYNFRVGLSPGITFFVMEGFAFEVQLNVLGYDLKVSEKSTNDGPKSKEVRQNVDFNINILSLQLGLAYYFGSKKHF